MKMLRGNLSASAAASSALRTNTRAQNLPTTAGPIRPFERRQLPAVPRRRSRTVSLQVSECSRGGVFGLGDQIGRV